MSTLVLNKNETTRLLNEKGTPVIDISFGVNWGKINRAGTSKASGLLVKALSFVGAEKAILEDVDLDLSLILADSDKKKVDTVYFGKLRSSCGSVTHTGDDRSGDDEDDGMDNEIITIKGLKVPSNVKHMYAVLNSYSHQKFDEIPYIGINIYDGLVKDGKGMKIAEFNMENDKKFAGKECAILARLDRTGSGWEVTVIGENTTDKTLTDLTRTVLRNY
ncbi:tellurium resistance protein [Proteus phage Vb_PmiP-P59]|uniref:Tellurium resistance protein n=1 Tax=Proteus phage Vb_PmiP-P59 TaxID=2754975 RepID=A0A7G5CG95_9CAUD|nr:tellurium resistance protein [Proteus phage Vb_PmiP-P59]QMV48297.1 tellurium resistance protein [Proteus phage Vb_PmiP-P59]